MPPNRRDMGMVFQAYSLFPNMTAEQNVEYGLRIRKKPKDGRRTRVRELLELVGLADAGKRYPHQLSGGMQQRVALARALAIEPSVLLLDEPLSALDAKVRVQLREEIRRIQLELGITTIYVTHDQEEALSISDRVAVMYGGKIEQVGAPAEMYGNPATPFVAEFIGTMNRLIATVADDGSIDYGGLVLRVDAARGLPRGERVLCLVRPETVDIVPANGATPDGALAGEVISNTFLGSTTRVRVMDESGRADAHRRPLDRTRRRRSPSARRSSRASRRTAHACSAWPRSQCFPCQIRTVSEHSVDADRLQREQP